MATGPALKAGAAGANANANGRDPTVIGPSILISGRLSGDEDLTVLGRVEGELSLTKTLVVEASGVVKAEVSVRNAIISGVVVGNVTATESVELTREGRMVGDIRAPRVILVDGASFRGSIDMGNAEPADRPARPAQTGNRGGAEGRAESARPPAPPARPTITAPASGESRGRGDGPPRPPPPPARVETRRSESGASASKPPPPPPRPENRPLPPSAPTVGAAKKKVVLRKKGR